MTFHKVPARDSYDVVVIGGGMGGLSAGAGLAHRGARVLVVEAHYRAGGYAHAFRRNGFLFDSAMHLTPGGAKGETLYDLLDLWGVADSVEFIPVQPMYRTIRPGLVADIRSGKQAFIESHAEHFPHEREGITRFVNALDAMAQEIRVLIPIDLPSAEMMRTMVKRCPNLLRMSTKSLQQMLDAYIQDPDLKSVLSTLWTYVGHPPSECSAMAFAMMLMSFVNENAYYVRGSFQSVADAFVRALEKFGGELVMPRAVDKILLDANGCACGIRLDQAGEEIRAKYVISNADALQTFFHMVGREHLAPQFAESLERRGLSISAFEVFLGVKADLKAMGLAHETFYVPSTSDSGESSTAEVPRFGISIPTMEDPTVAPEGHHIVVITKLAYWDRNWKEHKARTTDELIDEAEKVIPGLRGSIVYQDSGSPFTMHRYSKNQNGAMYGWDSTPQSLVSRLPMKSPVPGLFLAGHWTKPGGGLYSVVTSGQIAAKHVFEELERKHPRWQTA